LYSTPGSVASKYVKKPVTMGAEYKMATTLHSACRAAVGDQESPFFIF
jgi:hypothetical protein